MYYPRDCEMLTNGNQILCGDEWKAEKLGAFWRRPITWCFIKSDRAGLIIDLSINFRLTGESDGPCNINEWTYLYFFYYFFSSKKNDFCYFPRQCSLSRVGSNHKRKNCLLQEHSLSFANLPLPIEKGGNYENVRVVSHESPHLEILPFITVFSFFFFFFFTDGMTYQKPHIFTSSLSVRSFCCKSMGRYCIVYCVLYLVCCYIMPLYIAFAQSTMYVCCNTVSSICPRACQRLFTVVYCVLYTVYCLMSTLCYDRL